MADLACPFCGVDGSCLGVRRHMSDCYLFMLACPGFYTDKQLQEAWNRRFPFNKKADHERSTGNPGVNQGT